MKSSSVIGIILAAVAGFILWMFVRSPTSPQWAASLSATQYPTNNDTAATVQAAGGAVSAGLDALGRLFSGSSE